MSDELTHVTQYVLIEAVCCRSWPVVAGVRIGRCGYCGERPQIVGSWETREGQS